MDPQSAEQAGDGVRVDKWLWAARFFKTRSIARDGIDGGMVRVNGVRAKPARIVRLGDLVEIRKGPFQQIVEILAISERRGSAEDASLLYLETPASVLEREKMASEVRALKPSGSAAQALGRPTKRDRRRIDRLTGR
ncbi:MAG: ribosome-associated heat shock protein Hsp15 [Hyphomicrobiaceae bacterium]|jgi:ribosome-associated heat shock protein Hsp15